MLLPAILLLLLNVIITSTQCKFLMMSETRLLSMAAQCVSVTTPLSAPRQLLYTTCNWKEVGFRSVIFLLHYYYHYYYCHCYYYHYYYSYYYIITIIVIIIITSTCIVIITIIIILIIIYESGMRACLVVLLFYAFYHFILVIAPHGSIAKSIYFIKCSNACSI